MEQFTQWVKNLVFCFCLLELMCHLVRNADYRRYLRFFGGVLMVFMVASPVLELFFSGDLFEASLQEAYLRTSALDFQIEQEALADLQNRQISKAYEQEIERQLAEVAQGREQRALSVEVEMEDARAGAAGIKAVTMVLEEKNAMTNVFEDDAAAQSKQREQIQEMTAEISAVYGVERENIKISVKGQNHGS